MPQRPGLGKGLDALIPSTPGSQQPTTGDGGVSQLPVDAILRNPRQPRDQFDAKDLEELTASIREHGIIQPLIVSPESGGTYTLIAGERRLEAAKGAGLRTVPAISASWLRAPAMVVSEIGAILSPKVAPPMIAPAKVGRWAPSNAPAGYRMGEHIKIVPKLEPVEVETIQQIRKVNSTKVVPPRFKRAASQIRASIKPVVLIKTPIVEASIQAMIIIITIDWDIPSMAASQ